MDEVRNLIGSYLVNMNEGDGFCSSLDVKGIDTGITCEEIVESVQVSREDRY